MSEQKAVTFGSLNDGEKFYFVNCATDVYRKERHDCPHCGGKVACVLHYTSGRATQEMVQRISDGMHVVHVPNMLPWTIPFATLIQGRTFRFPGDRTIWVKDDPDEPPVLCDRCTAGLVNARRYGTLGHAHLCPDTPVLDLHR